MVAGKKWTMARFKKYCKDVRADLKSDFGEDLADDFYHDAAEGLLVTDPALVAFVMKEFGVTEKFIAVEIIADHIAG